MKHYLWLLPHVRASLIGEELVIKNGPEYFSFSAAGPGFLDLIRHLDGEQAEDELRQHPLAQALLPMLEEEGMLVRLERPLSQVLAGRPQASRQLAYYAQLSKDRPDRVLDDLARARVSIIGLGGIGSSVSQALAGAGVRNFMIADPDTIEETNLNRQFFYTRADVGRRKVDAASAFLKERHDDLSIETFYVNPFVDETPVFGADLVVFCGDYDTMFEGKGLTTTGPVLIGGYMGAVGVVQLTWPARGTACTLCRMTASGKADEDRLTTHLVDLPTSWNPSGTTINGLVGSLMAEVAIRCLSPGLANDLPLNEFYTLDMRTLALEKVPLAPIACRHSPR